MPNIEFRPCVPEDVDKAVPLIYASGPAAFSYVFTDHRVQALDFLRFAFQRRGGEFSYDNHFALLMDGKLEGVGALFGGNRAKSFPMQDLKNIVRLYRMRSLPVLIKGLKIERVIRLPGKNEICLAHLGISEQYRGQGLGSQLIDFLMNQVQLDPAHRFILDVSEENPKAQALYERLGFYRNEVYIFQFKEPIRLRDQSLQNGI